MHEQEDAVPRNDVWLLVTPLVRVVCGSAFYARYARVDAENPEYAYLCGPLGMLAEAGVQVTLATASDWPPDVVLAFGEDGAVVDLTERETSRVVWSEGGHPAEERGAVPEGGA